MSQPNQHSMEPLTTEQVRRMREQWKTKKTRSGPPQLKEFAERYNRSPHTIRNIIRGHRYPTQ